MNDQPSRKIEGPLENLRNIFSHLEETFRSLNCSKGTELSLSPDKARKRMEEVEDLRGIFLRNLDTIRDVCSTTHLQSLRSSPGLESRQKTLQVAPDALVKDLKDFNANLGRNVLKLAEINHSCERAFFRWRDETLQAGRSRELLSQEIESFLESIRNKLLSKTSMSASLSDICRSLKSQYPSGGSDSQARLDACLYLTSEVKNFLKVTRNISQELDMKLSESIWKGQSAEKAHLRTPSPVKGQNQAYQELPQSSGGIDRQLLNRMTTPSKILVSDDHTAKGTKSPLGLSSEKPQNSTAKPSSVSRPLAKAIGVQTEEATNAQFPQQANSKNDMELAVSQCLDVSGAVKLPLRAATPVSVESSLAQAKSMVEKAEEKCKLALEELSTKLQKLEKKNEEAVASLQSIRDKKSSRAESDRIRSPVSAATEARLKEEQQRLLEGIENLDQQLKDSLKKETTSAMRLRITESECIQAKAAIEVLEQQNKSLVEKRESLKSQLLLAQESHAEISGKYEALQIESAKSKHQLQTLMDTKAELMGQIDKHLALCKELQEKITSLTTKNKLLEESVAALQEEMLNLRARPPSVGGSPSVTHFSTTPRQIPVPSITPPFTSAVSLLNRSPTMPIQTNQQNSSPGKSLFHAPGGNQNPIQVIAKPHQVTSPPQEELNHANLVDRPPGRGNRSQSPRSAHESVHGSVHGSVHSSMKGHPSGIIGGMAPRRVDSQSETDELQQGFSVPPIMIPPNLTVSEHSGIYYPNNKEMMAHMMAIGGVSDSVARGSTAGGNIPDSHSVMGGSKPKQRPTITLIPASDDDKSEPGVKPNIHHSFHHSQHLFKEDRKDSKRQSIGEALATASALQVMQQTQQINMQLAVAANCNTNARGREIAELKRAIENRNIEIENLKRVGKGAQEELERTKKQLADTTQTLSKKVIGLEREIIIIKAASLKEKPLSANEKATMTEISKEVLYELDKKKEEMEALKGEYKKIEIELHNSKEANSEQLRTMKALTGQVEDVQKTLRQYKQQYIELETSYLVSQNRIEDLEDQLLDMIFKQCHAQDPQIQGSPYTEEDIQQALSIVPPDFDEVEKNKLLVCARGLLAGMKPTSIECSKARVVLLEVIKKLELDQRQMLSKVFQGLRIPA